MILKYILILILHYLCRQEEHRDHYKKLMSLHSDGIRCLSGEINDLFTWKQRLEDMLEFDF